MAHAFIPPGNSRYRAARVGPPQCTGGDALSPQLPRAGAVASAERSAERRGRREAAGDRDLHQAAPGLLQQSTRDIEPEIQVVGMWRDAKMSSEERLDGACAQPDLIRNGCDL